MPILANDRILEVSETGAGKSTHASYLFALAVRGGGQGVLVDPKGEWRVAGAPICRTPAQLEESLERYQLNHFVPAVADRAEYEEVYRVIRLRPDGDTRQHIVVWTDEAQNVCVSGASWAPRHMGLLQTQGRHHQQGHIVCCTRPVDIETTLRTEAQHVFVFERGLDPKDAEVIVRLSRRAGIRTVQELEEALDALEPYGCFWLDRREHRWQLLPPLSAEHMRYASRVARQVKV